MRDFPTLTNSKANIQIEVDHVKPKTRRETREPIYDTVVVEIYHWAKPEPRAILPHKKRKFSFEIWLYLILVVKSSHCRKDESVIYAEKNTQTTTKNPTLYVRRKLQIDNKRISENWNYVWMQIAWILIWLNHEAKIDSICEFPFDRKQQQLRREPRGISVNDMNH